MQGKKLPLLHNQRAENRSTEPLSRSECSFSLQGTHRASSPKFARNRDGRYARRKLGEGRQKQESLSSCISEGIDRNGNQLQHLMQRFMKGNEDGSCIEDGAFCCRAVLAVL